MNFGRRPRRQGQAELVDPQLHFGLGLDVTGQHDRASTHSALGAGQRSASPAISSPRSSPAQAARRPQVLGLAAVIGLARACARIGRESRRAAGAVVNQPPERLRAIG